MGEAKNKEKRKRKWGEMMWGTEEMGKQEEA